MTLRVLPAVMIDFLARKVGFDAGDLGLLAGIYYVGYSFAQIPVGVCLDTYSPKYVIFGCIMLCVSGLYITAFASSLAEIFIARFLIGIGSVAGILGAVKAIGDFYPKNYGVVLGLTVMIGVCGAYYGAEPIRRMLVVLSPEQVMQGLGLFGIILAASILALYSKSSKKEEATEEKLDIKAIFNFAIKNKKFWMIGLFGGLMVGPLEGFADLWGIKYLMQIHGLTNEQAALSITMIFVGLGVGGPILGYLTKNIFALRSTIVFSGALLLLLFLALFTVTGFNPFAIYIVCLFIGIFSAYQIVVFTLATTIASHKMVAIATAIVNMTIMIFGFVYHTAIGFVLDKFFVSARSDMLVYDATAYHSAFAVVLVGIVLGTIGFYRLKD